MDDGAYPLYRRRSPDQGGFTFTKAVRGRPFTYDNRHVVPYNPGLLRRYNCHINVEITTGIRAIKYIYKYIHKGDDGAVVEMSWNEVETYVGGRYLCAPQAAWRILSYHMHEHTPPTCRLEFHLENLQRVTFRTDAQLADVINRDQSRTSMLTEFFAYCTNHPAATADLLYPDAPKVLVWNKASRKWKARERGYALGRLYFAPPSQGERYYLRLLLYNVPSPKSFAYLRTFEGETYATFREACEARGLLENDREWYLCLTEAAAFQMGKQFHQLFATIIILHPGAHARECCLSDTMNPSATIANAFSSDATATITRRISRYSMYASPTLKERSSRSTLRRLSSTSAFQFHQVK